MKKRKITQVLTVAEILKKQGPEWRVITQVFPLNIFLEKYGDWRFVQDEPKLLEETCGGNIISWHVLPNGWIELEFAIGTSRDPVCQVPLIVLQETIKLLGGIHGSSRG